MLLDARPDRIDFRDREFRARLESLPREYPSAQQIGIFFSRYVKEDMILDQGSDGACTGFGLAAVVNYLNWVRKAADFWREKGISIPTDLPDPDPPVSEWMLYNTARLYDEWEGEDYSGSSCRGAMKGWHKHGVCKRDFWPQSGPGKADDQQAWAQDAARLPLGAYYRVNVQSISDVQAAIHEVGAVYCSAKVHAGWFFEEHMEKPVTSEFSFEEDGTKTKRLLPVIPLSSTERGGHAFALVGYTTRGFVVQNSWGPKWATKWGATGQDIKDAAGGFALLTYEDWVLNAHDAWVATLAPPMLVETGVRASNTRAQESLIAQAAQSRAEEHLRATASAGKAKRWSDAKARHHCIVMGNDGKLINERIDVSNAREGLHRTMEELLHGYDGRDVVIFAHGGLNDKDKAFRRAQVLGPWFEENGILPIFIVWRTGFGETLANIGEDFIRQNFPDLERAEKTGIEEFFGSLADRMKKRADRGFEVAAEKVIGKAIWSQMKQNAQSANQLDAKQGKKGGMRELADFLKSYQKAAKVPLRLHLLGHSAGSIILGHFATDLARFTKIASFGLLAPACTLNFANSTIAPLVAKGSLKAENLYIANLSRENERADNVGPYNKSLLYLVSRALELPRKAPLLGLDDSWILKCELFDDPKRPPQVSSIFGDEIDPFHQAMVLAQLAPYYALTGQKNLPDFGEMDTLKELGGAQDLDNLKVLQKLANSLNLKRISRKDGIYDVLNWRAFAAKHKFAYMLHSYPNAKVQDKANQKKKYKPISHGNIDNDIYVMNWAMARIKPQNLIPATDLSED